MYKINQNRRITSISYSEMMSTYPSSIVLVQLLVSQHYPINHETVWRPPPDNVVVLLHGGFILIAFRSQYIWEQGTFCRPAPDA